MQCVWLMTLTAAAAVAECASNGAEGEASI